MQFVGNDEILVTCSSEFKVKLIDLNKNVLRQWGNFGSGNGQFNYFRQVAIDEGKYTSLIILTIESRKWIYKGILKNRSEGTNDGRFTYPWGITIHKGMVVVSSDSRIQFFDKNGNFIKSWKFNNPIYDLASDGEFIYIASGNGVLKVDEDRKFTDRIGVGDLSLVMGVMVKNGDVVALDRFKENLKFFAK